MAQGIRKAAIDGIDGADCERHQRNSGEGRPRSRRGTKTTEPAIDRRLHLCLDGRGVVLCGGRNRPVLASRRRRVVKAELMAALGTDAQVMAIWSRGKPDAPLHFSDPGSQGGWARRYRALL